MSDATQQSADPGADLSSLDALRQLRDETLRSSGLVDGSGILYGLGYTEGQLEGLRLTRSFESGASTAPRFAGPAVPLLFQVEGASLALPIRGRLLHSPEATTHLDRYGTAERPICFVSSGYAAGWYSELLREPVAVRELTCRAAGAAECLFEALPAAELPRDPELPWAGLDLEALGSCARNLSVEREPEGPMFGYFDPMSPAAHIWGPVMILPYSGMLDSAEAIASVGEDADIEQLRVALVDVTGARIDGLEAVGLVRLLDGIAGLGVEAILVGLDRNAGSAFHSADALTRPLMVRELSEGIALAFQICQAQRV
jgi:hypothetical protein